jgi:hypothetical protein
MAVQRRTVGSVIEIPVDDFVVHAQILPETDIVVFDSKTLDNPSVKAILTRTVLFRVAANHDAILDGRWRKVGKGPLAPEHSKPVPRFIQDPLASEKFEIYLGGDIRPATRDDCAGLDRCAVWAVPHIEDRIRDHYAGKPNVWVEQMKL